MPKISFVMPQRDRGDIIQKSIQSVIDQTESDWELIIVDDHSSEDDDTEKVIKKFDNNRIKYVKMPANWPGGIPSARNFGNMHAKSPIIAVADSDDINKPRRAEVTIDFFQREKCDVFFGNYEIYREETNELVEPDLKIDVFEPKMLDERNPVPHASSAYTKEIALRFPYNSFFGKGEDYDLFIRLAKEGKKFSNTKEVIFRYVKHKGNITKQGGIRSVDKLIKLNNNIEKFDQDQVLDSFISEIYQ